MAIVLCCFFKKCISLVWRFFPNYLCMYTKYFENYMVYLLDKLAEWQIFGKRIACHLLPIIFTLVIQACSLISGDTQLNDWDIWSIRIRHSAVVKFCFLKETQVLKHKSFLKWWNRTGIFLNKETIFQDFLRKSVCFGWKEKKSHTVHRCVCGVIFNTFPNS